MTSTEGRMKVVVADESIEALYQRMIRHLRAEMPGVPGVNNGVMIAVLGRMAGYCIAMCYPDERQMVRDLAIKNMDKATKEAT